MEIELIRHPDCSNYKAWSDYMKVKTESAVLDLRGLADSYDYGMSRLNATARNRCRYAMKNGYYPKELSWAERNKYLQDIYEINTSKDKRQGREMSAGYLEFPKEITGKDLCEAHSNTFIACFNKENKMVAYITVNFCGEMAASSQILGHYDYLKDGCMIMAWVKFVAVCQERGIKFIIYSRWNDGFDGLRYWKGSVGMVPMVVSEK